MQDPPWTRVAMWGLGVHKIFKLHSATQGSRAGAQPVSETHKECGVRSKAQVMRILRQIAQRERERQQWKCGECLHGFKAPVPPTAVPVPQPLPDGCGVSLPASRQVPDTNQ